MGLSLRNLQEALYPLLGSVLSVSAINRVTLQAQQRMDAHCQSKIVLTPPILIVDGVWVDFQYALEGFKLDHSGHLRQENLYTILYSMILETGDRVRILMDRFSEMDIIGDVTILSYH